MTMTTLNSIPADMDPHGRYHTATADEPRHLTVVPAVVPAAEEGDADRQPCVPAAQYWAQIGERLVNSLDPSAVAAIWLVALVDNIAGAKAKAWRTTAWLRQMLGVSRWTLQRGRALAESLGCLTFRTQGRGRPADYTPSRSGRWAALPLALVYLRHPLRAACCRVFLVLDLEAEEEKVSMSEKKLAERLGMSIRTVRAAIRKLEDLGYLTVERPAGGRLNRYAVHRVPLGEMLNGAPDASSSGNGAPDASSSELNGAPDASSGGVKGAPDASTPYLEPRALEPSPLPSRAAKNVKPSASKLYPFARDTFGALTGEEEWVFEELSEAWGDLFDDLWLTKDELVPVRQAIQWLANPEGDGYPGEHIPEWARWNDPTRLPYRDPVLDALTVAVREWWVQPTASEMKDLKKYAAELREVNATPQEVRRRAEAFGYTWTVELTPKALSNNWGLMGQK